MNPIIPSFLCLTVLIVIPLQGLIAFGWAQNGVADGPNSFQEEALNKQEPSLLPSTEALEAELFDAPSADKKSPETESDLIAQMDAYLAETDDILDIGGQIFFRLESYLYKDKAFKTHPLTAPSFVDIHFDIRPHDRLRVYTQSRINHDFTNKEDSVNILGQTVEPTSFELDQLWLKFDLSRTVYLTLGRQRIKWGSGHFWNPTDFINHQFRDPLDIFDKRLGVALLKAHFPLEKQGWNLYGIIDLDEVSSLGEIGGAFRAEILIRQAEISLSTAIQKDQPERFGLDISFGLWKFDMRGEIAVSHNVAPPFEKDLVQGNPTFFQSTLQTAYDLLRKACDRQNDWIPQAVVGAEISIKYSDQDSLLLGGEYFYNDDGYDNAELYSLLLIQGGFIPFYMGRHYASAYLLLLNPGTWNDTTFILSALANLSDNSYLARLDYQVKILTYLNLNLFSACHFGDNGEFNLSIDMPPPELLPEDFKNGWGGSAIQFQAGIGLNLKF